MIREREGEEEEGKEIDGGMWASHVSGFYNIVCVNDKWVLCIFFNSNATLAPGVMKIRSRPLHGRTSTKLFSKIMRKSNCTSFNNWDQNIRIVVGSDSMSRPEIH